MQLRTFQNECKIWTHKCFGSHLAEDKAERNHRFLEEALELVQSLDCTASEAHQIVDYVFNRPIGDPRQEAAGSMVSLIALCNASDIDLEEVTEIEMFRCWQLTDKIREKRKLKPEFRP